MNKQILKARYSTTHRLVIIMNGDWTMKKEAVRNYNVEVPSYAHCFALFNGKTNTTEVSFTWCQVDESPEYMLQP